VVLEQREGVNIDEIIQQFIDVTKRTHFAAKVYDTLANYEVSSGTLLHCSIITHSSDLMMEFSYHMSIYYKSSIPNNNTCQYLDLINGKESSNTAVDYWPPMVIFMDIVRGVKGFTSSLDSSLNNLVLDSVILMHFIIWIIDTFKPARFDWGEFQDEALCLVRTIEAGIPGMVARVNLEALAKENKKQPFYTSHPSHHRSGLFQVISKEQSPAFPQQYWKVIVRDWATNQNLTVRVTQQVHNIVQCKWVMSLSLVLLPSTKIAGKNEWTVWNATSVLVL